MLIHFEHNLYLRNQTIFLSMNLWLEQSIEYANQRSYLDNLFSIYPTIPEGIRDIDEKKWNKVEVNFSKQNNIELIDSLLNLDLFPIKDSYIAYLKRDREALYRNPRTINRICGRIYEMGLDKVFEKCSEPKETNTQIGPMFKNWINSKSLGISPLTTEYFMKTNEEAILDASDAQMKEFAERKGFEPSIPMQLEYTLSRRAPSTTRPPL